MNIGGNRREFVYRLLYSCVSHPYALALTSEINIKAHHLSIPRAACPGAHMPSRSAARATPYAGRDRFCHAAPEADHLPATISKIASTICDVQ